MVDTDDPAFESPLSARSGGLTGTGPSPIRVPARKWRYVSVVVLVIGLAVLVTSMFQQPGEALPAQTASVTSVPTTSTSTRDAQRIHQHIDATRNPPPATVPAATPTTTAVQTATPTTTAPMTGSLPTTVDTKPAPAVVVVSPPATPIVAVAPSTASSASAGTEPPISDLVAEVEAAGINPGPTWSWSMGNTSAGCGAIPGNGGTGCTSGAAGSAKTVFAGSPTLGLVAHEIANAETENYAVPSLMAEVTTAEQGASWSPIDAVASCLVFHFMGFQDNASGTWQCPTALATIVAAGIR